MAINSFNAPSHPPIFNALAAVDGALGIVKTIKGMNVESEQLEKERAKLKDLQNKDSKQSVATREAMARFGIPVKDDYTAYDFQSDPTAQSSLKHAMDLNLQAEKNKGEIGMQSFKSKLEQAKIQKDKMLPSDKVLLVNSGLQIPRALEEISQTIELNKDKFGPLRGGIAGLNPYNETAKTIDAQMRTSAQEFGRYMEGGVLRKEDEEKYRKMFPQLTDTPEVAANKRALIERKLKQKLASDIEALRISGYDVSGLSVPGGGIPQVPESIRGGKGKNLGDLILPTAQAAKGAQFTADDLEAKKWADSNPNDPRAGAILQKLKAKGLR